MKAASMRRGAGFSALVQRLSWGALGTWALGFGVVVYLGLEGGGYDAIVHSQAAIAVWWILLVAVAVGALPGLRPKPPAIAALGVLAAFVLWTGLSLIWTESSESTFAELARVTGYLGIFALGVLTLGSRGTRRLVAAVGTGIVLLGVLALLSRLHPSWFPDAGQTAEFLTDSRERLSWPINYWNGLAALIAIGLPPVLWLATCARPLAARALAAAALPAMALAIFLTLSRGGIATAVVVVALFLVLAPDRLPKLATTLVAGAGSAVLVLAALARDELREGLATEAARSQGDELLLITLVTCLVVGLAQATLSVLLAPERRPGWSRVPPGAAMAVTAVATLAVLVAAIAAGLPGRAADGWEEFKDGGGPGAGTDRLGSAAGQNRYQFWTSAVRENESRSLTGTGSGTFHLWWTRDGETADTIRDAHNLYVQTLGELGIVGLALLAAFLATLFWGGLRLLAGAGPERGVVAAAVAGCAAFCLTAAADWMWQIPVLPVAALLLGAVMVGPRAGQSSAVEPAPLRAPVRVGAAALAVVAIVVVAVPLATTSLLRQSEEDAREGDLGSALVDARGASNVQPGAAGPRLQEALVLEDQGRLGQAVAAGREAADREDTNWRIWLVLSRIEAERGDADASIRDYVRSRSLNPNAAIFDTDG